MAIMFCHDCGEQFEDRATLVQHKKVCPAKEDTPGAAEIEDKQPEQPKEEVKPAEAPAEATKGPKVSPEPKEKKKEPKEQSEEVGKSYIKFEDCPKEVGLFAPGAFIGLRVNGIKREDGGVEITEAEFVR